MYRAVNMHECLQEESSKQYELQHGNCEQSKFILTGKGGQIGLPITE